MEYRDPIDLMDRPSSVFFLTKGPTFHVLANFYIIGFLTGWSYFSMSFFFLTKGPTFHVTANFYIIGFLMGWSYLACLLTRWLQRLTVTSCHLACDRCKKKPCVHQTWKLVYVGIKKGLTTSGHMILLII